jgi:lipopolysaccharide export system protein LptA
VAISISRLRRALVVAVMLVCAVVLGAYFYARHRVQNALKQIPAKMGLEIQQSANGFSISKSEQGRTLFRLQASKAVQFKQGGQVDLHDVTITLYGRDSSRFDQVYGQEFDYDQRSGNVSSKGEVSIDLQANPEGILSPDQTPPKELKNPLHLKTSDLVFNKNTGDAWTPAAVEFGVPQATGSAVGARYAAKQGLLTLESQVKVVISGPKSSTIIARRAVLEKGPREIVLEHPRSESSGGQAEADELTLFLRDDNTLDHTVASGNVLIHSSGTEPATISAQKLEVMMKKRGVIHMATLSGEVQLKRAGPQPMEASAGRALVSFGGRNTVEKIHADQQVRLIQRQKSANDALPDGSRHLSARGNAAQDVEVTAPAMDFFVANGRRLTRAETIGPPQISLLPQEQVKDKDKEGKAEQTRVTADKFAAKFDALGQLASVHGEANARVTTASTGTPDRTSASDSIDALFHPGTGIAALLQQGHFTYSAGDQRAYAAKARYSPSDQVLTLSGSPRIVDGGMATTANVVRINRASGEAFAEGNVKTTYSDLKPQPSGALLASSDPVHVTAKNMNVRNNTKVAAYSGDARLWQNTNVVEAPSIEFQEEQRAVLAEGKGEQKVSTILTGIDKSGKSTPVRITSNHLAYLDSERKVHFEDGVIVRSADLTMTSNVMDVFLSPPDASPARKTPATPQALGSDASEGPARLDRIIAYGSVVVTQPNRRAAGEKVVYTAADDKFVLTGGPPSIFDAERGKITGVSLTLYRRDDRVVVEGDSTSPAVTRTRVVR